MDRATATELLGRLHAAQGAFYAGGAEAGVRALLTDDVAWHVLARSPVTTTESKPWSATLPAGANWRSRRFACTRGRFWSAMRITSPRH